MITPNTSFYIKVFNTAVILIYIFSLSASFYFILKNVSVAQLFSNIRTGEGMIFLLVFWVFYVVVGIILSIISLIFSSKRTSFSWYLHLFNTVYNLISIFYLSIAMLIYLALPQVREEFFLKNKSL